MSDRIQSSLFPIPEAEPISAANGMGAAETLPASGNPGVPRLRLPERFQAEMRCESLDQRLPADHLARTIWDLVLGMDLSLLLASIKAVEGNVGRDATDPKILMALWLYAFAQGETSARRITRLCGSDRAYEWLCGGVSLNHRLLGEFRVAHWDVLDKIFSDGLGVLLHEGLLDLNTTAQDGLRVRASAGKSSFHGEQSLQQHLAQAKEHVAKLNAQAEADPSASTRREKAACEGAAQQRVERVTAALENLKEIHRQRESRAKGSGDKARASTTDPQARTMKMPDGGYRPAFNIQLATDVGSGLIVGVDATNQGSDAGLMDPMIQQIEERTGQKPTHHLADGGFSTLDDIEKVSQRGPMPITPIKEEAKKKEAGIDPFAALPKDSPEVAAWRVRMGTEWAKALYKLRAQSAELSNAQARNRGFYQVRVRGLAKVKTMALWFALIHNLLLTQTLRARRAERARSPEKPGEKG